MASSFDGGEVSPTRGEDLMKKSGDALAFVWKVLGLIDTYAARVISLVDSRALDLDFALIERRLNLLVLAASLLFGAAATAVFADPFEEPTPQLLENIAEDITSASQTYDFNNIVPGQLSQKEIDLAYNLLSVTQSDVNHTLPIWQSNFLYTGYQDLGVMLIEAYTYLMSATLFTLVAYFGVVTIRSQPRETRMESSTGGPAHVDFSSVGRFPLNVLYYANFLATLISVVFIVIGTIQLATFAKWRIMFTSSSESMQYRRMKLQDNLDYLIEGGNFGNPSLFMGTFLGLAGIAIVTNAFEAANDYRYGRKVEAMYVGMSYLDHKPLHLRKEPDETKTVTAVDAAAS